MEEIFLVLVVLQYLQEMEIRKSPAYLMFEGMKTIAYSQFLPNIMKTWVEYMSSQNIVSMLNMIYSKLTEVEAKVECVQKILAGDQVDQYCGGGDG